MADCAFGELVSKRHLKLHPHNGDWGYRSEAPTTQTPYAMVDGTGVGYATPFDAPFRRGAEIRQLRSHGKAVVVGYWQGES